MKWTHEEQTNVHRFDRTLYFTNREVKPEIIAISDSLILIETSNAYLETLPNNYLSIFGYHSNVSALEYERTLDNILALLLVEIPIPKELLDDTTRSVE